MAIGPRSMRVAIERVVFDGVSPGDRLRFARAFESACAQEFGALQLQGGAFAASRVDVTFARDATPESIAVTLARGIARSLRS